MNEIKKTINHIGLSIENSYLGLPDHCYAKAQPDPVEAPLILLKNRKLAEELSLLLDELDEHSQALFFSGNLLPDGATPIAQAYAGHQFGNFNMLGDGRAHLIAEHLTVAGEKVDIQLKGSGRTPYSRGGDGKGALGPMLREYLISEAMYGLGIPTSRSLAVVATGETVFRETLRPGAILTRIAASHLRVGTFQYLLALKDQKALKQMADFAIERHYPEVKTAEQPYLAFLEAFMLRQIDLVVNWMRVGFIHGVMNTDNTTISGETIDYGPCAFMDAYHPKTVFSSIDYAGRYGFSNQQQALNWNLVRFAETLLPIIDEDFDISIQQVEPYLKTFNDRFQEAWLAMMRKKLGLFGQEKDDQTLIETLLDLMAENTLDYTNTFRAFITAQTPEDLRVKSEEFKAWWDNWKKRQSVHQPSPNASADLMRTNNPVLIPRNHKVEEALTKVEEDGDLSLIHHLLDGFANPYDALDGFDDLKTPPKPEEVVQQTFCGT